MRSGSRAIDFNSHIGQRTRDIVGVVEINCASHSEAELTLPYDRGRHRLRIHE